MRKLFTTLCVLSLALTAKAHTFNANDGETTAITATDASSLEETEVTNPSVGPNAPERMQRVSLAQSASASSSASSLSDDTPRGGWSLEYLFPDFDGTDGAWGFNVGLSHGFIDANINFMHLAEDFDFLGMKLGGSYRFFPINRIYLEGNIGFSFTGSTYDAKNYELLSTMDKFYFGFYLTPRAGIVITDKFGITGSYNWDFFRFKTGKENVLKYFTVGLEFYY